MSYARAARFPILTSPWLVHPDLPHIAIPGVGGGAVWPTANLAIYIPFSLPVDATVNGVKFNCTAGTSAGRNFDVGIHNAAGVKLSSSGATLVAAGVNTWAANQPLVGGTPYYLGLSLNNTNLQVWRRSLTAIQYRLLGFAQEASAHPLPSTATFAQMAQTYAPLVVFTFANLG